MVKNNYSVLFYFKYLFLLLFYILGSRKPAPCGDLQRQLNTFWVRCKYKLGVSKVQKGILLSTIRGSVRYNPGMLSTKWGKKIFPVRYKKGENFK